MGERTAHLWERVERVSADQLRRQLRVLLAVVHEILLDFQEHFPRPVQPAPARRLVDLCNGGPPELVRRRVREPRARTRPGPRASGTPRARARAHLHRNRSHHLNRSHPHELLRLVQPRATRSPTRPFAMPSDYASARQRSLHYSGWRGVANRLDRRGVLNIN